MSKPPPSSPSPKQPEAAREVRALVNQLGDPTTLDALDDDTLAELAARVKAARTRRTRAGRNPAEPGGAMRLPQRALALDALDVLGVPGTPKLLASVVAARTGSTLDPRSLTTARRDDRDRWDRDTDAGKTPAPLLAPALHHELLEPVRALVTISTWPLAARTVTPHSPRHDHPASVLALFAEADRLADVDVVAADRVAELACRIATGIPGAPAFDTSPEGRARVRRAAEEERDRFAEETAAERKIAANRAQMLPTVDQIWGLGQHRDKTKTKDGPRGGRVRSTGTRR